MDTSAYNKKEAEKREMHKKTLDWSYFDRPVGELIRLFTALTLNKSTVKIIIKPNGHSISNVHCSLDLLSHFFKGIGGGKTFCMCQPHSHYTLLTLRKNYAVSPIIHIILGQYNK